MVLLVVSVLFNICHFPSGFVIVVEEKESVGTLNTVIGDEPI